MKTKALVGQADQQTLYHILFIIGLCHLFNNSLQAVIPAMFHILEQSLGLTISQLSLITYTLNNVASLLHPLVGVYTNNHPMPFPFLIGLFISMLGMLVLP